MPPGSFPEVTNITGGGKFDLLPGQWTDDTSMALCIAESIIQNSGEINPKDIQDRFYDWYQNGHLSSTGECFDIGKTTLQGMNRYQRSKNPYSGGTDEYCAGNGSIMRLAPVPIRFSFDSVRGVKESADSSRLTHGGPGAVDSCKLLSAILICFLSGTVRDKTEIFKPKDENPVYSLLRQVYDGETGLIAEVEDILPGNYSEKAPPEICGSGHSVKALEAALWAFYHTNSFRDGALKVVNLGGDADTTGAIYGQIAGSFYGASGIPTEWLEVVALREFLIWLVYGILHFNSSEDLQQNLPIPLQELNVGFKFFLDAETNYRDIHRKLLPCPRMYRNLEDFDSDKNEFISKLNSAIEELPDSLRSGAANIILGFTNRLEKARITVQRRCR